jgi:Tol biopolymer transport system component
MKTWTNVEAEKSSPTGAMLDPLSPPPDEKELDSQLRQGFTLLHAYAVDDLGRPVSGVRVRLQNAGDEAMTDERGHYWLLTPTPPNTAPDAPGTDTLIADKPGYKTVIHRNIIVGGEDGGGWFLDMEKGAGTKEFDDTNKLMKEGSSKEEATPEPEMAPETASLSSVSAASTAQISLPPSIVVGLSCPTYSCPTPNNPNRACPLCSSACTTTQSFTLESYVKQGLSQEWFPSWLSDSLKAGAVAYRTYGAYFVQHPGQSGSPNYDIRSDTCNQAFVATSKPPTSTSAAATATVGVALTADGVNAFKSEYASNTTGFGTCTSGQTGDGSSNWPCMADPIAAGTTGSGHGRGMSQYGSQWWAAGMNGSNVTYPRNWQCILEHYYNDNGNTSGAGTGLRTSFINGPGGDGPIAFMIGSLSNGGGSEIYTMNVDGSGKTKLTSDRTWDSSPTWSPGGKQIAYARGGDTGAPIYAINSDGSGETPIASKGEQPAWSPLGDKIAFGSFETNPCANGFPCLLLMNPDGSGQINLNAAISDDAYSSSVAWSPDATKIAFMNYSLSLPNHSTINALYTVNADGSGQTLLYYDPTISGFPEDPSWSPDGKKIAFGMGSEVNGVCGIYTVNADGTNLVKMDNPLNCSSSEAERHPSWSADGQEIIFESNRNDPGTQSYQIFSVNPVSFAVTLLNSSVSSAEANPDCRRCGRFDRF